MEKFHSSFSKTGSFYFENCHHVIRPHIKTTRFYCTTVANTVPRLLSAATRTWSELWNIHLQALSLSYHVRSFSPRRSSLHCSGTEWLHILRRCQRGARSSRAWQVVRARLDEVLRRCVVRHRGARGKHGGDPDGERCPLAYSDERRKRDRLLGILENMLTRLLELLL